MPVSESEKLGVSVLGCHFSEKSEHIPIKKRRFLFRASSPPCNTINPSLEGLERQETSPKSSNHGLQSNSNANCSPVFSEAVIRKCEIGSNGDKSDEMVLVKDDDFSGISILAAAACSNSLGTEIDLSSVSKSPEVPETDEFNENGVKNEESNSLASPTPSEGDKSALNNTSSQTAMEFSSSKANEEPITQKSSARDARFRWDLNVVMDAWEEPLVSDHEISVSDAATDSATVTEKKTNDCVIDSSGSVSKSVCNQSSHVDLKSLAHENEDLKLEKCEPLARECNSSQHDVAVKTESLQDKHIDSANDVIPVSRNLPLENQTHRIFSKWGKSSSGFASVEVVDTKLSMDCSAPPGFDHCLNPRTSRENNDVSSPIVTAGNIAKPSSSIIRTTQYDYGTVDNMTNEVVMDPNDTSRPNISSYVSRRQYRSRSPMNREAINCQYRSRSPMNREANNCQYRSRSPMNREANNCQYRSRSPMNREANNYRASLGLRPTGDTGHDRFVNMGRGRGRGRYTTRVDGDRQRGRYHGPATDECDDEFLPEYSRPFLRRPRCFSPIERRGNNSYQCQRFVPRSPSRPRTRSPVAYSGFRRRSRSPNFRPDTRIRRPRSPSYRDHPIEYNSGPRNNNSSPPSSRWVNYKERPIFDRRSPPPGRTDGSQGERFSFYDSSRNSKQNEYYRSGHPRRFSDINESGGRGRPRYVNNEGDQPNNGYRRGGFVRRYNIYGPSKRFHYDDEDGFGLGFDARDKHALELHARSNANPNPNPNSKPCNNGTDSRFRDFPRRAREDGGEFKRRSREEKDSKEESEHIADDYKRTPKEAKDQSTTTATTNLDSMMPNEVEKESENKPTLGAN